MENVDVVIAVLAVILVVLGVTFVALYFLNRAVDQDVR